MKRILLSALFAVPMFASAQTTIFTENFDAYNDQDWAGEVSSVMSTWSGVVGAASADDVPVTSAEFSSVSNSIQVTGPQAGGTQDAMVVFPSDYSSGSYEFSMKYKVAAGKGGYFNLQASGTNLGPNGAWLAEVFFDAAGAGYCTGAGQQYNFTYTNGAWIDIVCSVDIDNDVIHIYIEGTDVAPSGFAVSLESGGTGTGAWMSFGGVNLYSASGDAVADCEYYVDDLMLIDNTSVSTGLGEAILVPSMNVVPNPSEGNFVMNFADMSMENANVALTDILGKTIYSKNMSVVGNGSLPFNMNLRNGVYFVTVTDGKAKLTKKIIVKK